MLKGGFVMSRGSIVEEIGARAEREIAVLVGKCAAAEAEIVTTYFGKPRNKRWDGKSIAEIAEAMGTDPVDAVIDLLIDENLRLSFVGALGDPTTIGEFLKHPVCMVGSDALLIGDH